MTIGGTAAIAGERQVDSPPSTTASSVPDRVLAICPFLIGPGGGRTIDPSRDQRCTAVAPAVVLSLDKQRRLCLAAEHVTCATYNAALAAAEEARNQGRADADESEVPDDVIRSDAPEPEPSIRWPIPLTAPVVLEQAHPVFGVGLLRQRGFPQIGLAMLMVVAFGVLLAARIAPGQLSLGASVTSPTPGAPSVATSPRAVASAPRASAAPSAPAASPSPSASAAPSAVVATASSTPKPTLPATGRTYTVKAGDTLGAIAKRFGSTVKAISTANHIADPRVLHIGQVLVIP